MARELERWLALASSISLCACSAIERSTAHPTAPTDPVVAATRAIDPAQLVVTSGTIVRVGPTRFETHSSILRAQLRRDSAALELEFRYLGPSASKVALASGELRRQIGIKLRAQDTCNVVYVMWHIQPSSALEVSVKSNPGLTDHRECGDRGYTFVRPSWAEPVTEIELGDRHSMRAEITSGEVRVFMDGALRWTGALPASALAFDGPAGIRSDNGSFDIELRAPGPQVNAP